MLEILDTTSVICLTVTDCNATAGIKGCFYCSISVHGFTSQTLSVILKSPRGHFAVIASLQVVNQYPHATRPLGWYLPTHTHCVYRAAANNPCQQFPLPVLFVIVPGGEALSILTPATTFSHLSQGIFSGNNPAQGNKIIPRSFFRILQWRYLPSPILLLSCKGPEKYR